MRALNDFGVQNFWDHLITPPVSNSIDLFKYTPLYADTTLLKKCKTRIIINNYGVKLRRNTHDNRYLTTHTAHYIVFRM